MNFDAATVRRREHGARLFDATELVAAESLADAKNHRLRGAELTERETPAGRIHDRSQDS